MRKIFPRSLWFFILIGMLNTVLSQVLMQYLNRVWGGGFWGSSAFVYVVTSVLSYFLNRRFSFKNTDRVAHTAWRFALVIGVCYLLGHLLAGPATALGLWIAPGFLPFLNRLFPHLGWNQEQLSLLVAQVIFNVFNYIGQRFFAFNTKNA